jgi:hypothetical protein
MVSLADCIANDGVNFDFIEYVVYTPQQGTQIAGVLALREVLSLAKLQMLGLEPRTIAINLFANRLSGATVQNGDRITDANGISYRVVNANLQTLATRWSCYCVAEVG